MIYRLATTNELQAVYNLVQNTIKEIYPKYYPFDVVDFFCKYHSIDAISNDIEVGRVSILIVDDEVVGTGSIIDNEITRVYVLPKHQNKGYGTFILNNLEAEINKKFDKVKLEASLPAALLYDKRGYKTVRHEKYPVENDIVFCYEIMEKEL